jgi:hypothetical protein
MKVRARLQHPFEILDQGGPLSWAPLSRALEAVSITVSAAVTDQG